MSAGGDNIFARWSRRKQAVRESEAPDVETAAVDAVVPEGHAAPADPQLAAEPDELGTDEAEPAEPLPRLEDLTAESDLSAFLRKGVPKALKSAAMRKMWSLDPTIRDFVGPSEYAWDFNKPGSMGGFGPLDDAGETVANFLSTMSGGARAGLAKALEVSEPLPASSEEAAALPEPEASASPEGPADALSADQLSEPAHPEEPPSPVHAALSGELDETPKSAEPSRPAARPRHGRALPR
jgi:hypothetical protein